MLILRCESTTKFVRRRFKSVFSGVTRRGEGGAPGDTLQGVTPEEKNCVGKFTRNSG